MLDKMKQLMEVKKQADQLKKELDQEHIEVTDIKGIKIVITGSQEFQSIEIDENLLVPANKNRLQGDLQRSLNSAVKRAQNFAAQKMKSMMGFNIPGL